MIPTKLNNNNYAQWAKSGEVFLLGKKKFQYLGFNPLASTDPKYANW